VTARFSNGTGLPAIPDADPNASPRGMAIRFNLADHVHTDIISHSTDGFPTRTGQEFLEFLRAVAATGQSKASPSPIEAFLRAHPKALAFVQAPKPNPTSFAREAFFGVTAYRFINKEGAARYGRYRIVPEAGVEYLEKSASPSQDYLFDELAARVAAGPIRFEILVQIAGDRDVVDDSTVHWPADRPVLRFGTIALTATAGDNDAEQQRIIFDPIPRVDGIEPSDDPLLELRAAVYLLSGRRRRSETRESQTRLSTSG
jgi:catalase